MKLLNLFRTIGAAFLLRWYFRNEDYEIVDKSEPTPDRLNPMKVVIKDSSTKEEKYEFASFGRNTIILNNIKNLSPDDLRPLIKLARGTRCNLVETQEVETKLEKYLQPFEGEIEVYDYATSKRLFLNVKIEAR